MVAPAVDAMREKVETECANPPPQYPTEWGMMLGRWVETVADAWEEKGTVGQMNVRLLISGRGNAELPTHRVEATQQ